MKKIYIFLLAFSLLFIQLNSSSGGKRQRIEADQSYLFLGDAVSFSVDHRKKKSKDYTYNWDFGDGETSEEAAPMHTYTQIGVYTVSVTLTKNNKSKTLTREDFITVVDDPSDPLVKNLPPQYKRVWIEASKDASIRGHKPNKNQGHGEHIGIKAYQKKRALVAFAQEDIQNVVGDGHLISAHVSLKVTRNHRNWGPLGRTVNIHRMNQNWVERQSREEPVEEKGKGKKKGKKKKHPKKKPKTKTVWEGVTWNSPHDTKLSNKKVDGETWDMDSQDNAPWVYEFTDQQLIKKRKRGLVHFDVTLDVHDFLDQPELNHGWLIKAHNENKPGALHFASREHTKRQPPRLLITVLNIEDQDTDGVPDHVENGAPNNGDGNNDGIPDREQQFVASLPNNVDGAYVTLVTEETVQLLAVQTNENPDPEGAPPTAQFPLGFFSFDLTNLPEDGKATVTLLLPGTFEINAYLRYGPTPDQPEPHWYSFLFDGQTGAKIKDGQVVLYFVDGAFGDDDLEANGKIQDMGSPTQSDEVPDIKVTPDLLDFGTGSETLVLTVRNEGTADLNVQNISAAQGGLVDISPNTISALAPGASQEVQVSRSVDTPFSTQINFTSDDPDGSVAVDVIAEEVVVPIAVLQAAPTALAFGTGTAPLSLVISNSGNVDLTVSSIVLSDGGLFEVTPGLLAPIAPGSQAVLTVSRLTEADFSGTVTLHSNDALSPHVIGVSGAEVPRPDLAIQGSTLNFGETYDVQTFTVSNLGTAVLDVADVSATQSGFVSLSASSAQINPGDSVEITVTRLTDFGFSTDLIIQSNDPDTPSALVSVSGNLIIGPVSAIMTTAVLPSSSEAGQTINITVQARDANGSALIVGGETVAIRISGGNPQWLTVSDQGNGTYTASYAPPISGTDRAHITVNGAELAQSPYTYSITVGGASASTTTASVPNGTSEAMTHITVQAKDAMGNHLLVGGDTVAVIISGANADNPPVTDNGNGTYTASYLPLQAGTDNINITLNGTPISASYSSVVSAGAPNALNTTALVPSAPPAGQVVNLVIQARDNVGNNLSSGGDTVTVQITGVNGQVLTVVDNGNGTYTASYTPLLPGLDRAHITINGGELALSPYEYNVQVGVADSATSSALVPAGAAGEPSEITVLVKDAAGNLLPTGGDTVTVSVSGANTANPTVSDNGDGTYTATYTPTVLGTDTVTVTVNGTPLPSPYISEVTTGGASAQTSTANLTGNVPVGQLTQIVVQAKDAMGHNLTQGGDTVTVQISGTNAQWLTVTDNGNGTYSAAYTPILLGTDRAHITINNNELALSPYTYAVVVGAADANTSTANVPAGFTGYATQITVQAKDAMGHNLTQGGDTVVVSISGANTDTAIVVDNGNGTYTATYTPAVVGTDNIDITLNAVALPTTYISAVTLGGASAQTSTANIPDPAVAGNLASITVQAKDPAGNNLTSGGDNVTVRISGVNPQILTVVDNGDGTYTASYPPTALGTDRAHITINNNELPQSPYNFTVVPGDAVASTSTANVPSGTAGQVTVITVQAKDSLGHNLTTGGDTVTIAITGTNTANPAVVDNGNGTYTASYTPTNPGTDNVAVTLNAQALPSAYVSSVSTGVPSAQTTTANVPANSTVGQLHTITVTARDAAGNLITTGGANVGIRISGSNAQWLTVTDNGDGTYTASYTPTVPGTDKTHITINNPELADSPYLTTVVSP